MRLGRTVSLHGAGLYPAMVRSRVRAVQGAEMLADTLMALAALAGNTVVAAATTDAREAARRGFARVLGRGDPNC